MSSGDGGSYQFVASGIDLITSEASGKGKRQDVLESLQAEVEQISAREDVLASELDDVNAQLVEAEAEVMRLKRVKAEQSGAGALSASLHMTKMKFNQTRLKEELLARLRLQDNSLTDGMTRSRARINKLRGEAVARNARFDRLASSLSALKRELVAHLERSNAALAARNEAAELLKAAREDDAAARAAYVEEASQLQARISQSTAAAVAAARASALRNQSQEDAGEVEGEDGGPGSGNLTEEQEQAARSTILRLDVQIIEHEAVCADLHRQTQQLQEVFRAMIGQAGLDSLDQLVEKFAEAEAFKYEIYGYVTHTSAETSSYEEMLRDTRQAQAEYVAELAAEACSQREQLDSMRGELAALQRQAEGVTSQRSAVYAVARRVVLELLRVYAAVGGDDSSRLSLLPMNDSGVRAVGQEDGDEATGALVVGKEEITSILGDIEQATSDLGISLGSALRDLSCRGLLVDGLDAWAGLIVNEQRAASRMGDATDGPDHSSAVDEVMQRSLRLVQHTRNAIDNLQGPAVEELCAALHKQPATPARVVTPASATGLRRRGVPVPSAVSSLKIEDKSGNGHQGSISHRSTNGQLQGQGMGMGQVDLPSHAQAQREEYRHGILRNESGVDQASHPGRMHTSPGRPRASLPQVSSIGALTGPGARRARTAERKAPAMAPL